jgi:hypothetical protein
MVASEMPVHRHTPRRSPEQASALTQYATKGMGRDESLELIRTDCSLTVRSPLPRGIRGGAVSTEAASQEAEFHGDHPPTLNRIRGPEENPSLT